MLSINADTHDICWCTDNVGMLSINADMYNTVRLETIHLSHEHLNVSVLDAGK